MANKRLKLGELLLSAGKISEEQLQKALEIQKTTRKRLGEALVEGKFITEEDIIEVLEFQLGIPHIDLDKYYINKSVATLIPESIVRRYELIAIDKKNDTIMVAMVDPLNIFALDDIKISIKTDIQPVISTRKNILKAIDRFYSNQATKKVVEEFEESFLPISIVS